MATVSQKLVWGTQLLADDTFTLGRALRGVLSECGDEGVVELSCLSVAVPAEMQQALDNTLLRATARGDRAAMEEALSEGARPGPPLAGGGDKSGGGASGLTCLLLARAARDEEVPYLQGSSWPPARFGRVACSERPNLGYQSRTSGLVCAASTWPSPVGTSLRLFVCWRKALTPACRCDPEGFAFPAGARLSTPAARITTGRVWWRWPSC